MAGSQNAEDNPVGINVTALVDIIFCLCLFFMCSLKFKQLEGKIESWLPPKGQVGPVRTPVVLEEIRVFMRMDPQGQTVQRRVGNRPLETGDAGLMAVIMGQAEDYKKAGKTEVPVIIDATPDVPWREVVHIMDLCRLRRIDRIELAQPLDFLPAK